MTNLTVWNVVLAIVAGYLIGSFPTGVLVARVLGAPDPRSSGSGHTGGSNLIRLAGWPAGVFTGAVDIAKGALAVWLVLQIVSNPWIVPLTGTAAVAGHCWPVFARYRGGMGVATAAGLALWLFPLAIPITGVFYYLLLRLLRHQARAAMVAAALIPLVLIALRVDAPELALGVGMSLVLVARYANDFHRVYKD